jgi:type II secretory pathway pseudopilin PulG
LLRRGYAANPERRMSPVRKWLTSATLFVAVAVLIGDGISLVTNVLGGEFTLRFLLKTLVVGGVAAGVVGCYLWDLKGADTAAEALPGEELPPSLERRRKAIGRAAAGAVVAVLIAALVQAGSPGTARMHAADEQRVQALQTIASAIQSYRAIHHRLPESLEQLREQPNIYIQSIIDPRTEEPYDYRRLDAKNYELCATFDTDTSAPVAGRTRFGNQWNHPAGRHCFNLAAQK